MRITLSDSYWSLYWEFRRFPVSLLPDLCTYDDTLAPWAEWRTLSSNSPKYLSGSQYKTSKGHDHECFESYRLIESTLGTGQTLCRMKVVRACHGGSPMM